MYHLLFNSCAKDKARILNNQFESVFTNEDLSSIPIMTFDSIPQCLVFHSLISLPMEFNYFLENHLGRLLALTASPLIFSNTVPPKLLLFSRCFLHSHLILEHFQKIGLLPILNQFIRKAVEAYHLIIDQYL